MKRAPYELLAQLFDFPGPEFTRCGRELIVLLGEKYPEAAEKLTSFLAVVPQKLLDQQELYTRTFDVQAITTLDVGYVMFGDDYKRAELLSHLAREHKAVANECHTELADHLPNVLRLLPKMQDQELVEELVMEILVPALMLMIREFDSERIEKKNQSYQKHYKTLIDFVAGEPQTAYRRLLEALLAVLSVDFQVAERMAQLADWSDRRASADFLGLIEREIEIEDRANPVNSGCDA